MTRTFMSRSALAGALLAISFTLTQPLYAAGNQEPVTLFATAPTDSSPADPGKDRPHCKKTYQWVHHGAPGKGTDALKLVRMACPIQPA